MMYVVCPGGACIDIEGVVLHMGMGFTNEGAWRLFVRGIVVFRSGLNHGGLEVGNFTPSSPKLAQTILKYLEEIES